MKVEMEKGIQARVFQQRSRLDEEIDVLWHLMQRCRRNYDSEVQAVIWMTGEIMKFTTEIVGSSNYKIKYGIQED
jgi:hypothetical protein